MLIQLELDNFNTVRVSHRTGGELGWTETSFQLILWWKEHMLKLAFISNYGTVNDATLN